MMTFDSGLARLLLEICRFTYAAGFDDAENAGDKQDALSWINRVGGLAAAEPVILHGSKTSVACIAPYPDRNIVAYMGTRTQFDTLGNALDSIKDWSQNFEALLVPFKLADEHLGAGHPDNVDKDNLGGRVHDGFLEELCAVQGQVVAALADLSGRGRPVYVTGHSQGGAEAALATRALLAAGFPVAATYTFAAPRPGDQEFTRSVPGTLPVHRIEFGDDIVPHVPPTLIARRAREIARDLERLPFLADDANDLLELVQKASEQQSFAGLGTLCYGSHKTRALRVDMSAEQEAALFYDRLWSLVRHPERWAEHHHLAGTTEEVREGKKGNYTALVSDFQIVN
jgi:triacylglycerol lipase